MHYTGFIYLSAMALVTLAVLLRNIKALRIGLLILVVAWATYATSFIANDVSLREVVENTNIGMDPLLRFAASWVSSGPSLMLFSASLAMFTLWVLRAVVNWRLTLALIAAILITGLSVYLLGAFDLASQLSIGAGLNPLLKSFWVSLHPPLVFLGYAGLYVAGLALLVKDTPSTRRIFYTAFTFLSAGLVVGAYWSYVTFGWGGFWAWDPVETAQFMVWVIALALIHTPRFLPQFLSPCAFLLASGIYLALYVTRTGMSPLHGFTSPSVGIYLLLAVSLLFFLLFIRGISLLKIPKVELTPHVWSRLLTFFVILAAALIVYGSLLFPSIGIALGTNTSPPQLDEGMWFYNSALLPLVLVTLVLAPLIYLEAARRLLLIYIGVGTVLNIIAVVLVMNGIWVYSPLSHIATNIAVITSLVWGILGIIVVIYSMIKYKSSIRILRALHLIFFITFIAVILALPYAYNREYFIDMYIVPGMEADVEGVTFKVTDYRLGLLKEEVDIYTPFATKVATFYYASHAVEQLRTVVQLLAPHIEEGKRLIEGNPTLREIVHMATARREIPLDDLKIEASPIILFLTNASLLFSIVQTDSGKTVIAPIITSVISLSGMKKFNGVLLLNLTRPVYVELPELSPLAMTRVHVTASGPIKESGGNYTFNGSIYVMEGNMGNMEFPYELDTSLTVYLMTQTPGSPLHSLYASPWWDLLLGSERLVLRHGAVEIPKRLPVGAYAEIRFDKGNAVVRYEVSGEVRGIHGLVASVLLIPQGLSDMYIAVFTPYVAGRMASYPEPLIYYLAQMYERLNASAGLSLTALLASGFYIDQIRRMDMRDAVNFLMLGMIDMYQQAAIFEESKSAAWSEGINISIKKVPFINVLWFSSIMLMVLTMIYAFYKREIN